MSGGIRQGIFKLSALTGLVGGLVLSASLAASATTPPPGTVKTSGDFEFSNVSGYQAPGSGSSCGAYAPGATFGLTVNVWNKLKETQDQAFTLQVYKMTDLSSSTCYTEAQLEAMVHAGSKSTEVLATSTNTQSYHFVSQGSLTVAATGTGSCGYYQFDLGLAGTGSFAPRPGYSGPPVSGFVLFNGAQCNQVSAVTVSPTPTPPAPRSATNGVGAGTLANTGGGPAPVAPYALLLALGLASLLGGARLLAARRPGR